MQEQKFSTEPDLTVMATCHILQCTPPTVYKLLKDGRLVGYVVGARGRRITAESVQRLRSGR